MHSAVTTVSSEVQNVKKALKITQKYIYTPSSSLRHGWHVSLPLKLLNSNLVHMYPWVTDVYLNFTFFFSYLAIREASKTPANMVSKLLTEFVQKDQLAGFSIKGGQRKGGTAKKSLPHLLIEGIRKHTLSVFPDATIRDVGNETFNKVCRRQ
jgi:hypothetical protein